MSPNVAFPFIHSRRLPRTSGAPDLGVSGRYPSRVRSISSQVCPPRRLDDCKRTNLCGICSLLTQRNSAILMCKTRSDRYSAYQWSSEVCVTDCSKDLLYAQNVTFPVHVRQNARLCSILRSKATELVILKLTYDTCTSASVLVFTPPDAFRTPHARRLRSGS